MIKYQSYTVGNNVGYSKLLFKLLSSKNIVFWIKGLPTHTCDFEKINFFIEFYEVCISIWKY